MAPSVGSERLVPALAPHGVLSGKKRGESGGKAGKRRKSGGKAGKVEKAGGNRKSGKAEKWKSEKGKVI